MAVMVSAPGPVPVTVRGSWTALRPVTLRATDRGAWNRVDAAADGTFAVTLAVVPGEPLELLRNESTLAYVAILGSGIAAVDVNAFYDEATGGLSHVLGRYEGRGVEVAGPAAVGRSGSGGSTREPSGAA